LLVTTTAVITASWPALHPPSGIAHSTIDAVGVTGSRGISLVSHPRDPAPPQPVDWLASSVSHGLPTATDGTNDGTVTVPPVLRHTPRFGIGRTLTFRDGCVGGVGHWLGCPPFAEQSAFPLPLWWCCHYFSNDVYEISIGSSESSLKWKIAPICTPFSLTAPSIINVSVFVK